METEEKEPINFRVSYTDDKVKFIYKMGRLLRNLSDYDNINSNIPYNIPYNITYYVFFRSLRLLDEYSELVFKTSDFKNLLETFKKKLEEFSEKSLLLPHHKEKNKKLSLFSRKYLAKYFEYPYDFQCHAYTVKGTRCKNTCKLKSKHFCNAHIKNLPKIIKMLSDVLIKDIALMCISYLLP